MKSRIKRLAVSGMTGSAFYVSSPSDVFYLSGFSGTFGRIVATQKKSYFITDPRYAAAVRKSAIEKNFEVVVTKNFKKDLLKLLSKTKTVLLGNSTGLQDYLYLKETKKVEINSSVMNMRLIKDPSEITLIKKAIIINESGIRHITSILKPGVSEKDLALEFDYYTRKKGADSLSFDPIVAFGSNSAVPHHKTSIAKLKKNTFILIDCGVKYKGYCSDLTRCISFGIIGAHFKAIQKHYNMVKNAKEAGLKAYKSGSLIRQADAKTRFFLKKHGELDKFFTHSLGHGMGIDVHEPPAVNVKEKTRFKPGMVLSCEPGIYIEDSYGIRIEDDYLITAGGPEKMGTLSDGLIIKD